MGERQNPNDRYAASMFDIRYFKRFRMELDLRRPPMPAPLLPDDYFWLPWDDGLLNAHARTKADCFRGEMDVEVFPSLGSEDGCLQLMRAIRLKPGFLPGATWLIGHGAELVATVQGVRERSGWGAVQNLGVSATHRGRGLGKALILKALEGFSTARLPGVYLEVTAANASAVQLYRRVGFRCKKTVYKAVEQPYFYPIAEPSLVG